VSGTRRTAECALVTAAAAGAGVLLFLASAGPGLHALAWFGLVPLLLLVRRVGSLAAFVQGCICGLLFHVLLTFWTLGVDGMNPANFATVNLANSAYYGLFALVARGFERRLPAWSVVALPTAWVVLEYMRSHVSFLAFPWGVLGYSQYAVLPVARVSAFTSVYGVSFLLVAVNVVLADLMQLSLRGRLGASPRPRRASLLGLIALGALVAAANISSHPRTPASSLRVGLVQADAAPNLAKDEEAWRVLEEYERLTREITNDHPTLVAWPSGVIFGKLAVSSRSRFLLAKLARDTESWLLVGASRFEKAEKRRDGKPAPLVAANAALLFAPSGKMVGSYDKIRLLPFDEYLPLRGWLKWPSWIVSPDRVDAVPGTRRTVFRAGDQRFGVSICWENYFPDDFRETVAQGVDFMVSMTNESFTDSPTGHRQMLAMNVFRAIENRVPILRTTPTGFSALIEPDGRMLSVLRDAEGRSLEVAGTLVTELPLSASPTFYARHGNVFVRACFAGFVPLSLALLVWPRRARAHDTSPRRNPATP
jgi:apolipoprotein N-acyltransferase